MKKIISAILTLALIITSLGVFSLSFAAAVEGDFEYTIENGSAIILKYKGSAGNVVIPPTLGGSPVKVIGDLAFERKYNLLSVTIPEGVTHINYCAFYGCSMLASVNIPDSVTSIGDSAFVHCSSLQQIAISENVTSLGNGCFGGCNSLNSFSLDEKNPNYVYENGAIYTKDKTVLIAFLNFGATAFIVPESVKDIKSCAFLACVKLKSVSITGNVETIGDSAFVECEILNSVVIPSNVEIIGFNAFKNCIELDNFDVQSDNTVIGEDAFAGTAWYNNQPDGIVYIGKQMYKYKGGMPTNAEISIMDGVKTIPDSFFYEQVNMKKIIIPDSVTKIGARAFSKCTSLSEIVLPDSVTRIGGDAFENTAWFNNQPGGVVYIGKFLYKYKGTMPNNTSITVREGTRAIVSDAFFNCDGLASISASEDLVEIGDFAFSYCSFLQTVTLPQSITYVGMGAFDSTAWQWYLPSGPVYIGKTFLYYKGAMPQNTTLEIKDGTVSISAYALAYMPNLVGISLPSSLKEIGQGAFESSTNLKNITIHENVTEFGMDVFMDCGELTVRGFKNTPIEKYARRNGNHFEAILQSASITGTARVGETLTAQAFDFPESAVLHYKWMVGGFQVGVDSKTCEVNSSAFVDAALTVTVFDQYGNSTTSEPVYSIKKNATTPSAPMLLDVTADKITVMETGCEFTLDGEKWQQGNVFTGLLPNTEYTVYCRTAENGIFFASDMSEGLSVTTLKKTVLPPAKPVADFVGMTEILISPVDGCEYSLDGENWIDTNMFEDLVPGTLYMVYARYMETDTAKVSEKSEGLVVKTLKNTVNAPAKPTASIVGANAVTLTAVDGCEYSKDGTTWQTSNVFEGLLPNTEYTFYSRLAETDMAYASEKSEGLVVKTLKNTANAPAVPVLFSKTPTTVTLTAVDGCEYSKDGTTWQNSNVFEGLTPGTEYNFYARMSETDDYFASEASQPLCVTTALPPSVSIKGNNTYGTILRVNVSNFPNGATLHYQWKIDGENVGEDADFHMIFIASIGKNLTVTVTDELGNSVTSEPIIPTKAIQSAPDSPALILKTDTTVILKVITNREYSLDGVNWQGSGVFEGLTPGVEYNFYARMQELDGYFKSDASKPLSVKTLNFCPGDGNGDGKVSLRDAMLAFMSVAERVTLTDNQEICLDVDQSGNVDLSDAMAIFMFVAGKRETF